MDYCVQLSFDNINAPEVNGYGVDHVKVAEGLGCKAIRVFEPEEILPALEQAKKLLVEHRVPVVVEVILERVTNVSMGLDDRRDHRVRGAGRVRRGRPDRALRQPRLRSVSRRTERVDAAGAARPGQVQGHADRRRGRGAPRRRASAPPPGRRGRHRPGRRRWRRHCWTRSRRPGYRRVPVEAAGPIGVAGRTAYARRGPEAVIELAAICGLAQARRGRSRPPAPLTATSRGVGEVIARRPRRRLHAPRARASAAARRTDGGVGMLQALGARVLDADGPRRRPGRPRRRCGGAARPGRTASRPGRRHGRGRLRRRQPADRTARRGRGLRPAEGCRPRAGAAARRGADAAGRTWSPRRPAPITANAPGAGAAGGVGFAAIAVLGAPAAARRRAGAGPDRLRRRPRRRRPGRHRRGLAGRADPARQGTGRRRRGGAAPPVSRWSPWPAGACSTRTRCAARDSTRAHAARRGAHTRTRRSTQARAAATRGSARASAPRWSRHRR